MRGRRETSPELTAATDRAAAVALEFLEGVDTPEELVEAAFCECFRELRTHDWSPENALAYCKKVVAVQARAAGASVAHEGRRWMTANLVHWLLTCYY